jgi:hypothetical protein
MANYANQNYIELTEFDKIQHNKDSRNIFIKSIDFKYEEAAMRNLSGNGFKLWRYLLKWYGVNKTNKNYDFSPAAIIKSTGMGKNGPNTAFEELVRIGYLYQPDAGEHVHKYVFRPVLPEDYILLKDVQDF